MRGCISCVVPFFVMTAKIYFPAKGIGIHRSWKLGRNKGPPDKFRSTGLKTIPKLLLAGGGGLGLRVGSGSLVRGEVAVAGAGGKFAFAARGNDVYLHGAESAVFFGVGGIVAERVLIANVASDLVADVVDVVDIFREEGHTTGGGGDIFQGAHGFFLVLLVLVAEKTNGVDDHVGLLNFAHGFFKRVAADVIFAVGDHEENFFVLVTFFK